ncbi:MAG: glycosyltransferase family 39 protein, partial [Dehalococcoidia bacterium]
MSAALIALDPFFIAHSRLFHLDALLTGFMTLSVLGLLVSLTGRGSYAYLAFSGSMAGLAFLTKSPAFFLAPFAFALTVAMGSSSREGKRSRLALPFLVWATAAGVVYFALWPAMWVDPVGTIRAVLDEAFKYAAAGHTNFFRGEITRYPGNWFYPLALLFRTTPLTLLGATLSAPLLFKGKQRTSFMALLGFAILFAAFISFGTKKFDRYLLPVFPALNIVAAGGFSYAIDVLADSLLRSRLRGGVKKEWLFAVSMLAVLLIQGVLALPHHPYYLTYYSPLTGGPNQAPKTMLEGGGEGLDLAAEYLNRKENAEELNVATWNLVEFAPLFVGRAYSMKHYVKEYDPTDIDYFVFYLNQVQRNLSPSVLKMYHNKRKPEYVISLHGIDYAWIYPNVRYADLLEYIESRAQPNDVILLNTPSLFSKNYKGSLPHYVLCGDCSEAEIAEELVRLSTGRERVWYLSYPDVPNDSARLTRYQLATHATKVEEHSFPHVTLYCYLLPDPPSFRAFDIQPSAVDFEDKLMLRGYDFAERTGHWGKDLGIVLEWQASREVEQDYKAFLHLVDEKGRLWGQGDKLILNDALLPTSLWRAGGRVLDRYNLRLLAGIPPGRYWVEVGVYQTGTGHRLSTLDENQAPVGTAYTLGEVEVIQSPLTPSLDDLEIQYQLSLELVEGLKL